MPDTPSPDDTFADLFGKLPDPQRAAGTEAAPSAVPGTRRAARAARTEDTPATGESADAAPAAGAPPEVPAAATTPPAVPPASPADAAFAAPTPAPRASGTLEALFHEEPALAEHRAREKRHERDRRKSRVAGWVVFTVVLALLGGIAAGGVYVWTTYEDKIREFMGWEEPKDYEEGLATGEALVTIIQGDTGSSISQTLFAAGVTKTPEAFYDHLIDTAQEPTFVPGVFALQQKMTSEAALAALQDPANKRENTAQLPEGLTVAQSLTRLSDGLGIPLEEFEAAVADPSAYGVAGDSLEGWLFPATYPFEPGVTAEDVIRTLVNRTVRSLDDAEVPVDRRHEILTIASIIQREARYEEDFFKVSRVIQNRLDPSNTETAGLLQMDSTAQYGFGELHDGTVSSSAEALEDDNPWNTYLHPGLPIGPISNPGDVAIDAAMHPVDGPWLYFVTVNLETGETVFTETYNDHLQAVEQWRSWCADNPDSGC